MQVFGRARIRGRALEDAELLVERSDGVEGAVDVLQRRAAGRDQHRLAERRDVPQQRRVEQIRRCELVGGDIEFGEEVRTLEVEGRSKEGNADLARIALQLGVVLAIELERLAMRPVRRAKAELVVVRLLEEVSRVERAVRALLHLDGVSTAVL